MKVNTSNLSAVVDSIRSRLAQVGNKDALHQSEVDAAAASLATVDTSLASVAAAKDPGPRVDLDFSFFDNCVAAFKQNGRISQADVGAVGMLIQRNTPSS